MDCHGMDRLPGADTMIYEILIILVLIIINGIFVMSEIAIVSARKLRLQQRANEGDKKAKAALELANSPNRFLSTTQIGITLISILTGAFGGATLATQIAATLRQVPQMARYSDAAGIVIVVLGISYFSLVFGELFPKRVGLNSPERIASAVATPMNLISRIASPVIFLLGASTDLLLMIMDIKPPVEPPVTEEEVKILLEEGTRAGVFEETEQDIVERVFRLSDKKAAALMIPRTEVIWLDIGDSLEEIRRKISEGDYFFYPVGDGSLDEILGFVRARDMLSCSLGEKRIDLKDSLIPPIFIPESMPALRIIELFKQSGVYIAMVIDEYGSIQGIVTLRDVLEAIVGDLPPMSEAAEPQAVQREDGSWLLDGMLPADEFKDIFGLRELPEEDSGYYKTIGGFVMMHLGKIPSTGDHFEWNGLRFEVVDMDENRVDKLLVAPLQKGSAKKDSTHQPTGQEM